MKGENNWKESINNKDKWKNAWNREWAELDKQISHVWLKKTGNTDQMTRIYKCRWEREREQKRFTAIPINS